MKNVTMDNPLTTREIYDELFNFKESLKNLADDFGELANGIMLSLAKTGSGEPSEDLISREEAFEVLAEILDENHVPIWICDKLAFAIDALPSADRPTDGDLISRQDATSIPILPKEHRKVFRNEDDAFETGWNEALACVNMLPSADRPRDGDLISREEAIEAIEIVDWYHQNRNKDMVSGANSDEHQAWYKADDVYKALSAVPSAETVPQSEQYKKGFEDAKRAFLVEYARESQNMRKRIAQLEVMLNAQKAISADRPKGEWIDEHENGHGFWVGTCNRCDKENRVDNFCPNCGAAMR